MKVNKKGNEIWEVVEARSAEQERKLIQKIGEYGSVIEVYGSCVAFAIVWLCSNI